MCVDLRKVLTLIKSKTPASVFFKNLEMFNVSCCSERNFRLGGVLRNPEVQRD